MKRRLNPLGRVIALTTVGLAAVLSATAAWTESQGCLLDMVRVEGGTFRMGDTFGDGNSDEKPAHVVSVSSYWLSKYEVTVGQFRQFVAETGYVTSAERQGGWLVWTGSFLERKYNASWKNPY